MAVCNDKVCNAKVACNECGLSLTPSMCGIRGLKFTESVCDGLKLIGADDVTINQGVGIDLSQGVHAYDGNGDEIEYTFVPSEIPKCAVGEHTVKYTVVGVANKMRPTICQRDRLHISSTCDDLDTLTKDRIVIIKQADPPKISGVEMLTIEPNTDFNPMSGVSAVDDNGVTVEVEFDGEYTKEASGEIASFETSLMKYMPKVEVSLEPIQDGTPWIDDEDYTEPYLLKASPKLEEEYNHESLSLVGGTVNWNQYAPNFVANNRYVFNRCTGAFSDGVATLTVNADGATAGRITIYNADTTKVPVPISRHKYILTCYVKPSVAVDYAVVSFGNGNSKRKYGLTVNAWNLVEGISTYGTPSGQYAQVDAYGTLSVGDTVQVKNFMVIDLTAFFGSATIADYIYSLEQANAGAGVAFFKSLFPNDYYPYNQGQLMSVKTSGHKVVGFNQWDEEWENGVINSDGSVASGNRVVSKNYIPVISGTNYYMSYGGTANYERGRGAFYDANYNLISYFSDFPVNVSYSDGKLGGGFSVPNNACYFKFCTSSAYGTTYKNDICINISDPSRNGRYERYASVTYPLDADLELRGLFKLDANNKIYNDGDLYPPSGRVSRRYALVDLGTLNWSLYIPSSSTTHLFYARINDLVLQNGANGINSRYPMLVDRSSSWTNLSDKQSVLYVGAGEARVGIRDDSYSSASDFKTAMNGAMLLYELATPTTENADPYTSPQMVFSGGTEEFIDTRTVPIPVGNKTRYMRIVPIEGHDEVTVHTSSNNLVNEDAIFGDNGGVKQPNGSWYIADQRSSVSSTVCVRASSLFCFE